jgi:hypothetical protein
METIVLYGDYVKLDNVQLLVFLAPTPQSPLPIGGGDKGEGVDQKFGLRAYFW